MMAFLLIIPSLLLAAAQPPACDDAASCKAAALEAAARQDYETFHDLAWRAVQRGQRNDPDLMHLLARAQSLSGRPGDALVMLRRLAEMGIATDAREHEDFRRVRALPGWADLEARLAAPGAANAAGRPPVTAPDPSPSAAGGRAATPVESAATSRSGADAKAGAPRTPADAPAGAPAVTSTPAASAAASPAPPAGRTPLPARRENAMRLTAAIIEPVGLAYDSVSRRFVVGDRRANRVLIADQVFNHVNDLIGPASGGFGGLTALAIDGRRGDLWVTSSGADGGASLHKLQLVSGRLLATMELPAELRPVALSDMAITDGGLLLLADAAGSRLLTMQTTGARLEPRLAVHVDRPSSVAAAGEAAYVAHADGIVRVDLASGRVVQVNAQQDVRLAGLRRIRWYRGSLIAIQQEHAESRLVRVRLGADGVTATALEPLDDHPGTERGALTIWGDAAWFVARVEGDPVIRRVELR